MYENQVAHIIGLITKFQNYPIFILNGTDFILNITEPNICIEDSQKKYETLLTTKALNDIKDKFIQQAEEELESAKKSSESFFGKLKEIPLIFRGIARFPAIQAHPTMIKTFAFLFPFSPSSFF